MWHGGACADLVHLEHLHRLLGRRDDVLLGRRARVKPTLPLGVDDEARPGVALAQHLLAAAVGLRRVDGLHAVLVQHRQALVDVFRRRVRLARTERRAAEDDFDAGHFGRFGGRVWRVG